MKSQKIKVSPSRRAGKSNKIKGFTLVELLVVISVFIVISALVLSIIITIVRGSKNADSLIVTRQNGEQAMTQVIKSLRFAQSLDIPNPIAGAGPVCSSNGVKVSRVKVTAINALSTDIKCPASFNSPNFISFNGSMLTNIENVMVTSCSFCIKQGGGHPIITVSFTLSKRNTNSLVEEKTSIPFQSSVELRNLAN